MNGNPFYVEPVDFVGSVERGLQATEMARQRRSLADLRNFATSTDFSSPTGRQQFMGQAIKTDPQIAAQYGQLFASMDENQRAQTKAITDQIARSMLAIKQLPPEQQPSAYAQAQAQFPDHLSEPYSPYVIDQNINEARSIDELLKQQEGFTLGEGQVRFDAQGNRIAGVPKSAEPKWLDATGPGGVNFKYNDTTRQTNLAKPGGGFYTLDELGMSNGQGGFDDAVNMVLGIEGGYVANDAGQGPTNFGINSQANPDIDVSTLTPEAAKKVYKQRYWDALGLDALPPVTALVAFDAAVNHGQGFARQLLEQTGGDPEAMLQAREQAYRELATNEEFAGYLPGWLDRLGKVRARLGGQGQPQGGFDFSQFQTPKQAAQTNPVEQANKFRDEFTKLTKDYREVSVAYQKIKASANDPSAAGDIALIFGFMKMLDPGSTVREGEFATAENAQGVPQYIANLYNKVLTGERLPDAARQDFVGQAQNVFSVHQRLYDSLKGQYTDLATRSGLDPRMVIVEGGIADAPEQAATKTVVRGPDGKLVLQ